MAANGMYVVLQVVLKEKFLGTGSGNLTESSVFTATERRVMEYAEAASQTPPAVTDELSDALLADLGPAALVELAARKAVTSLGVLRHARRSD